MKENDMLHAKNIILLVNISICIAFIAGCGDHSNTPPNPAIVSFQATPSIISKGQSTTLSLNFANGRGFVSDGVVSKLTFGNATTIKPTATTTYTLTVTNPKGVVISKSALVTLSPIQGRFSSTARITNDARDNHTATFLPTIGKVLLAGGVAANTGGLQFNKSAELFDPATGISTPTGLNGFMRYSSALHTATYLGANNSVLITGGWSGRAHNDAQIYNPATGTFSLTAGSMTVARSAHTATLLNNGLVLIIGGFDGASSLASAELYNPATGTFAVTGSMTFARSAHTATLLNNGKVLIAGGTSDFPRCELYDPSTGTFTQTGSMTFARSNHTATLLSGGVNAEVLIAGGSSGANAELYDPVTGTFALTNSMTVLRTFLTATLLEDSRVILAGGSGDNTAEFYDPNTRTFAGPVLHLDPGTVKPMPFLLMNEVRTSHTATLLPKGTTLSDGTTLSHDMVFIVGGTGAKNKAELLR
jgi:hypothetical protein